MAIDIDKTAATKLLHASCLACSKEPVEECPISKTVDFVMGGKNCLTYRYIMFTALLAKAVDPAIDILSFDVEAAAQTAYPTDYVLPWDHIGCGATTRWLARERALADEGITTPDCTFERCSGCGACMRLGVDNQLAQPRVLGGARND